MVIDRLASGFKSTQSARQACPHHACQHIAGAGRGQSGVSGRVDHWRLPRRCDDSARAFEHHGAGKTAGQFLGGSKAMQDWAGTLDRLHRITVPALILVGEQDNLLPASRAIHAKIAGSRFVLLRNSGHGTNIWRAGAFTDATLDFLAAVDAGERVDGDFVVP